MSLVDAVYMLPCLAALFMALFVLSGIVLHFVRRPAPLPARTVRRPRTIVLEGRPSMVATAGYRVTLHP